MEGLNKRIYALVAVALVSGLAFQASARATGTKRTEAWMERTSISAFGPWRMERTDSENPRVSYRMDAASYKELNPFGIVARELTNGRDTYDTVLIASNDKGAFHDPRVCFTAQGWEIAEEKTERISTRTRGVIPVTLATMVHKDFGRRPAIFFYRGPEGFAAGTAALKIQMLKNQLVQGVVPEGVFYRFMAKTDVPSQTLVKFVSDYMDASGKTSANYF